MKKVSLSIIIAILTSVLMCGCGSSLTNNNGSANNNADKNLLDFKDLNGVFAFSNESGTKLVTFTEISEPNLLPSLNAAIGTNSQYLQISYIGYQNAGLNDNGNYDSYNFENIEGHVFKVDDRYATSNQTYLLVNNASVPAASILSNTISNPVALTYEQKAQISSAKGRQAVQGWVLARFDDKRELLLISYEPYGTEYLMSIALKTKDNKYKFLDYSAVSDDPSTVWRVDDQGILDPQLFSVLLCTDTKEGFIAILNWAAPEGETTIILCEKSDSLIETGELISRYWGAY